MYELLFSLSAERYFKKLKDKALKGALEKALLEIAADPYCGSQKKGDLSGFFSYDLRYRKINYEIAYAIREDNGKRVIVVLAGTRENFYEQLKRYLKASDSVLC